MTNTLVTEPEPPWPCFPAALLRLVAAGTVAVRVSAEPLSVCVTRLGTKDAMPLAGLEPESAPADGTPPCWGELLLTEIPEEMVVGTPASVVVITVGLALGAKAPPLPDRTPVGDGRKTEALPFADQGCVRCQANVSKLRRSHLQETVVIAEDMLVRIDRERDEAAVTGQIVVYSAIVLVVRTVWTASDGSAEIAELSVAAGQFVIDGAHEIIVLTWVAAMVMVVREPLTEGARAVAPAGEESLAALGRGRKPPVPVASGMAVLLPPEDRAGGKGLFPAPTLVVLAGDVLLEEA